MRTNSRHLPLASRHAGALRRAVAFYRRHGIHVQRVMSDNGAGYRSALHALACRALKDPPPPHPALPTTRRGLLRVGLGGALAAAAAEHERARRSRRPGASHRQGGRTRAPRRFVPRQAEGPAANRGPLEIRLMLR